MANPEHVAKLNTGVRDWNNWRKENPVLGEDLRQGGVKELEQHKIHLRHARLEKRDLRGFDLSFADLHRATLWHSDLSGANLEGADLSSVNLNFANLSGANLRGAILRFSRLAEANVSESLFSGSFVYASSIWNVKGQPKEQVGIVITPKSEPEITVDNLEVAQFI
jgi:Pentapeptide repeats (8 copies)